MFSPVFTLRHAKRMLLVLCCICLFLLLVAYIFPNFNYHSQYYLRFALGFSTKRAVHEPVLNLDEPARKPFCSDILEKPVGRIAISLEKPTWNQLVAKFTLSSANTTEIGIQKSNPNLEAAANVTIQEMRNVTLISSTAVGIWSPVECVAREKLLIILPYRNRDEHLRAFLNHMHPYLRHQNRLYTIMVVEQLGQTKFNRASLFNVGFRESNRIAHFDCFIFHDVDLLPEVDQLPYKCGKQPIHLSVAVDSMNYKLLYPGLFGGAVALSRTQFERIRGFSNVFFGWGGEDDDLYYRVRHYGFSVFRYPSEIARYTMIKHKRDKLNPVNPHRHRLLKHSLKRLATDGYPEVKYKIEFAGSKYNGLVYWVSVHLDEHAIMKSQNVTKA